MISPLPFDSSLFNYPVGKTNQGSDWNEKEFLEEAKDYQLIYIFSQNPVQFESQDIVHVDTKLTFQKELKQIHEETEVQKWEGELVPELIDLAFLSGSFSRFKLDRRLKNKEFENLYNIWIENAWEGKQILSAPDLAGMVTVDTEKEMGKIGLIAVSEKQQGKGWGKKLVKAAESKALSQGAQFIQIPTQEQNIPACNLYTSLGYSLIEKVYVYHWWKR
ncbi:GNAT family N-acetyltransferase [Algoriphagus pacificus]|uniref:GNAT family N-acetyltransferase n=1 Tax=Algoriphagus pacificus TaxID=2811234 RepID=A0ABS3CKG6_9BACT|nr:GNAT family N-acetyltransferase [Algoriphagus pacificus]MBN7817532.1 GNAT family N-acetyltransferase [Algoriphagus pacificus]